MINNLGLREVRIGMAGLGISDTFQVIHELTIGRGNSRPPAIMHQGTGPLYPRDQGAPVEESDAYPDEDDIQEEDSCPDEEQQRGREEQ